jgi:hypothetical protein
MDIELLLAHADDSSPVLEGGLPPEAATAAAAGKRGTAGAGLDFRYDAGDPDSLPEQRWGLVVPEGPVGDRLLGLIEPLRLARQREQDDNPVRIYRVPAAMSGEDAYRWQQNVYWDESVAEEDVPRYLLILGELDQVSLDLQRLLAADCAIGRLAFSDDHGYASYVDKVLRCEREPPVAPARSLFYTVRDGTAATTIGYRALMTPSLERARERKEKGDFRAGEILELDGQSPSSLEALLEQAARPGPSVLFSMSHGVGAPRGGWRSIEEQRALQGALSLGGGRRLTGADMADRPFLPGGAWFCLACFGGGTPAVSEYAHWLSSLKAAGRFPGRLDAVLSSLPRAGERPFVASLPRAVLASPRGPQAVIAHVDLAWTYSFQDMGAVARSRPSRFQHLFKAFVDGKRVGLAYRELFRFFSETSVALTELLAAEEAAAFKGAPSAEDAQRKAEKANLWMLQRDLAGYVLLGDPAARLHVSARSPRATPAPEEPPGAPAFTAPPRP